VVAASQNDLGVIGGDTAGFPNGRRPGDDVTDVSLRVAMGVLCHAGLPPEATCVPADAKAGTAPFTDGVVKSATAFDSVFPYLKTPNAGSR
jgi:hypothetical protein